MKNILLGLIFMSSSIAINAQETDITPIDIIIQENVSESNIFPIKSSASISKTKKTTVKIDKVCYGEMSKVAFYEALISKNGFKINLKNSTDLVIRNTEEIISKKRDETLYSEEEE